jgi:D-glycero-D-manno-heptose 1,7-bisphosphate phosphatase
MVLEAAADLALDLRRSWFIGDKVADIECGQRAGLRTILVLTGYGAEHQSLCHPDFISPAAPQAADLLP